jgi:hypothetical protein
MNLQISVWRDKFQPFPLHLQPADHIAMEQPSYLRET